MQLKPEGYGNDSTARCGNCDGIKVNGIRAFRKPFRHVFFLNQNTTELVAMKMKYRQVGISN